MENNQNYCDKINIYIEVEQIVELTLLYIVKVTLIAYLHTVAR